MKDLLLIVALSGEQWCGRPVHADLGRGSSRNRGVGTRRRLNMAVRLFTHGEEGKAVFFFSFHPYFENGC